MQDTVYQLNFSSGHYYIGRSKNVKERYRKHKTLLRTEKHDNSHMQSVYNIYGQPTLEILLVNCDGFLEEQKLLDVHFGSHYCLNQSSNAYGGDGLNSVPPVLTRDKTIRCKIKTTDFKNIEKLLKILPAKQVATYYQVSYEVFLRVCRQNGLKVNRRFSNSPPKMQYSLSIQTLAQFLLDSPKMSVTDLAKKYGVKRDTIYRWQSRFNAFCSRPVR